MVKVGINNVNIKNTKVICIYCHEHISIFTNKHKCTMRK